MGSERLGILIVVFLLLVLGLFTLKWAIPHEQQDLHRRSMLALEQQGLSDRVSVEFSGRDATLSAEGEAATELLERGGAVVEKVYGVRKVSLVPIAEVATYALPTADEEPGSRPETNLLTVPGSTAEDLKGGGSKPADVRVFAGNEPGIAPAIEESPDAEIVVTTADPEIGADGSTLIPSSVEPSPTAPPALSAPAPAAPLEQPVEVEAASDPLREEPDVTVGIPAKTEPESTRGQETEAGDTAIQTPESSSVATEPSTSPDTGSAQEEAAVPKKDGITSTAEVTTVAIALPKYPLPPTQPGAIETAPEQQQLTEHLPADTLLPPSPTAAGSVDEGEVPLFAPGSSLLTSEGYLQLAEIAISLRTRPGSRREVDIYTQDSGNQYYNILMSRHRANIVLMTFMQYGVAPSQVVIRSYIGDTTGRVQNSH